MLAAIDGGTLVILVVTFCIQLGALVFMYVADRELKLVLKVGIKQVEMLTLKKSKYFFVYSKRKGGVITKHAFKCMIAYYVMNTAGFTLLLLLSIEGFSSFVTVTSCILGFSNAVLVPVAGSQPVLDYNQKNRVYTYLTEEKKKCRSEGKKPKGDGSCGL